MIAFALDQDAWLAVLRRYLLVIALGSLIWEFAHMPLYTLWETGTAAEIVFAAVHCTAGDVLIATAALVAALCLFGNRRWPACGARPVALVTIALGIAYTAFSEWLNVEVRETWAYRDLMPIVPVLDVGLSPMLQWVALPGLAFWLAIPQGARR